MLKNAFYAITLFVAISSIKADTPANCNKKIKLIS